MTSFSSILSSIGQKPQAPQQSSSAQPKSSQSSNDIRTLTSTTNGVKLSPNNAAAGVKRKSEEPEGGSRPKMVKSESGRSIPTATPAAPSSRFQLSGKGGTLDKSTGAQQAPAIRSGASLSQRRPTQNAASNSAPRAGSTSSPTPPSTANGAPPAKRGFASIMERAKAAQEVAKTAPSSTIKHKSEQKLSRRERMRMMEEAKAEPKGVKRRKQGHPDRSRSTTPMTTKLGPTETSYKGTMKKKADPLAYRGTMRAIGPGEAKQKAKTKGQAQDKYGGYASWSDLDEAEDEDEDIRSDGSSDMEGGFDDVEEEETLALKTARKEDAEALAEEEAHRKEKLARQRRLEELSKTAKAKRKY